MSANDLTSPWTKNSFIPLSPRTLPDTYTTTVDNMVYKMLVADYTGSGIPYTIAGMPLSWADDNSSMKHLPMITEIESRWTKYGADCLEEPRKKRRAHHASLVAERILENDGRRRCAQPLQIPVI